MTKYKFLNSNSSVVQILEIYYRMALTSPSHPSIQSFYKREVIPAATAAAPFPSESTKDGDGFTEEELENALDPLNRKWNPQREYDEVGIGGLVPGPRPVTFVGRVVNVSTMFGRSPKQPKAAGWHYVLLKDDDAAVSVG